MASGKAYITLTLEADLDIPDLSNYSEQDLIKEALKLQFLETHFVQIADETGNIVSVLRDF